MKSIKNVLNNAIYEKLKIDSIKIVPAKFPIDGSKREILEFLEEKGFIKYNSEIDSIFYDIDSKLYYTFAANLWFADTSREKISKNNPIFNIDFIDRTYSVYYYTKKGGFMQNIVIADKEKFLKELNERFGWK